MAREISIERAKIRILSGTIGHIGPFVAGKLRESMLPFPVTIVDSESGDKIECNLVHVVPFNRSIPVAFIYASFGKLVSEMEVLQTNNRENVNQLAFYTYEYRCSPSDPNVS